MDIQDFVQQITPELHGVLRQSLALGHLPDGKKLGGDEKAALMQALIAWEVENLPEEQRMGYLGSSDCASKTFMPKEETTPLHIVDNNPSAQKGK